jgi:hypothetical protein
MRELFIYYRVDSVHAVALRQAIHGWQAGLRAECPGLIARLLVRADETPQGMETWMETYAMDAGTSAHGIDDALAARIAREAGALCGGRIAGARHLEAFRACAC